MKNWFRAFHGHNILGGWPQRYLPNNEASERKLKRTDRSFLFHVGTNSRTFCPITGPISPWFVNIYIEFILSCNKAKIKGDFFLPQCPKLMKMFLYVGSAPRLEKNEINLIYPIRKSWKMKSRENGQFPRTGGSDLVSAPLLGSHYKYSWKVIYVTRKARESNTTWHFSHT